MSTNFANWKNEYIGGRVTKVYLTEQIQESRPTKEQQQQTKDEDSKTKKTDT
ncbi:MAG: hypothetical protein KBC38_03300 [Candidatus Pacebacteria bacterium]|nr:hypothetical protein [Candidatus Paceibacterota bacterium]MBP9840562.1 hypothetical protein [Candidatus Paceibacterota bacterium]